MKIALAGPSGSGKTTIANYITEKFGYRFIAGSASLITDPESQEYLRTEFDYKPEGHKAVIRRSNENPDFGLAFQTALLQSRTKVLTENQDFVTDRSPIDNLAYFMLQCSSQQRETITRIFIEHCIEAVHAGVTHLILVRPNDGWTENNGSRVDNNYHQHMVYAVFEHVYQRYIWKACPNLKVSILSQWDLESRKAQIDHFLKADEQEG